ncbi:MAG: hypothetical protein RIR69_1828 [Actinomycetota bacterium]
MITVVVAAFFLGWALSSVRPVPAHVITFAEKYVLTVALPAVIITKMSRVSLESQLLIPVIAAWLVMGACAGLVIVLGRILKWSRSVTGALLCVGVLGNTSFLGLGMVEGLLGRDHLPAAIAYDQLGTFLALSLWGAFVTSTYGSDVMTARLLLSRLFRFAPFVALLVSVPVRFIELPGEVFDVLDVVGRTVAPVAMATVGLRFRLRFSRTVLWPSLWGLGIKMLIVPAVVVAVVLAGGWEEDVMWSTTVLQAGAPPMVTAGIVAIRGQLDEQVVAFVVGAGTIIGFASVPALSLLL